LTYGQVRSVTLRAGLPAADGRTLERDVETELSFDDRPPMSAFRAMA
jgi:uncharacterized protein YfaS (alpha-2-macroglobulin family)